MYIWFCISQKNLISLDFNGDIVYIGDIVVEMQFQRLFRINLGGTLTWMCVFLSLHVRECICNCGY